MADEKLSAQPLVDSDLDADDPFYVVQGGTEGVGGTDKRIMPEWIARAIFNHLPTFDLSTAQSTIDFDAVDVSNGTSTNPSGNQFSLDIANTSLMVASAFHTPAFEFGKSSVVQFSGTVTADSTTGFAMALTNADDTAGSFAAKLANTDEVIFFFITKSGADVNISVAAEFGGATVSDTIAVTGGNVGDDYFITTSGPASALVVSIYRGATQLGTYTVNTTSSANGLKYAAAPVSLGAGAATIQYDFGAPDAAISGFAAADAGPIAFPANGARKAFRCTNGPLAIGTKTLVSEDIIVMNSSNDDFFSMFTRNTNDIENSSSVSGASLTDAIETIDSGLTAVQSASSSNTAALVALDSEQRTAYWPSEIVGETFAQALDRARSLSANSANKLLVRREFVPSGGITISGTTAVDLRRLSIRQTQPDILTRWDLAAFTGASVIDSGITYGQDLQILEGIDFLLPSSNSINLINFTSGISRTFVFKKCKFQNVTNLINVNFSTSSRNITVRFEDCEFTGTSTQDLIINNDSANHEDAILNVEFARCEIKREIIYTGASPTNISYVDCNQDSLAIDHVDLSTAGTTAGRVLYIENTPIDSMVIVGPTGTGPRSTISILLGVGATTFHDSLQIFADQAKTVDGISGSTQIRCFGDNKLASAFVAEGASINQFRTSSASIGNSSNHAGGSLDDALNSILTNKVTRTQLSSGSDNLSATMFSVLRQLYFASGTGVLNIQLESGTPLVDEGMFVDIEGGVTVLPQGGVTLRFYSPTSATNAITRTNTVSRLTRIGADEWLLSGDIL